MRPKPDEYAPYYGTYIDQVPETDILPVMRDQLAVVEKAVAGWSEADTLYRYESNKWSLRELFVHLSDAERVFGYRALRALRRDHTPLAGFEQDDYAVTSCADDRPWAAILEEFRAVRRATIPLFESVPDEDWDRTVVASDVRFSILALAYIIVGHVRHHLRVIDERYRR